MYCATCACALVFAPNCPPQLQIPSAAHAPITAAASVIHIFVA